MNEKSIFLEEPSLTSCLCDFKEETMHKCGVNIIIRTATSRATPLSSENHNSSTLLPQFVGAFAAGGKWVVNLNIYTHISCRIMQNTLLQTPKRKRTVFAYNHARRIGNCRILKRGIFFIVEFQKAISNIARQNIRCQLMCASHYRRHYKQMPSAACVCSEFIISPFLHTYRKLTNPPNIWHLPRFPPIMHIYIYILSTNTNPSGDKPHRNTHKHRTRKSIYGPRLIHYQ